MVCSRNESNHMSSVIQAIEEEKELSSESLSSIKETPRYSISTDGLSPMLCGKLQKLPDNITMQKVTQDHFHIIQSKSLNTSPLLETSEAKTTGKNGSKLSMPRAPRSKRSFSQRIQKNENLELEDKKCSSILIVEDNTFN
eukprot:CAMPEP_0170497902 /NCGR_PEP_ID=MMETSP0208-20121228/26188_1 /TAXON_ID=197538 /ORGANISM="Strombidium inclinatum, Strain S3" /LENGTH=140 /DNA_ID=CAMNT_0010774871 /DNA_START=1946 /DNA_END=2368 /DNA_ORIENTATION=+